MINIFGDFISSNLGKSRSYPELDDPDHKYLRSRTLPEERNEAKMAIYELSKFCMVREELYRRLAMLSLFRCIGPEDVDYTLREVHEGIRGDHSERKTMALKILRQGYFWLTINKDVIDFVKNYHKCQVHAPIPRQPLTKLSNIMSPIPFAIWGIDLMGLFPIAKGWLKFCVVTINYMINWVEAFPLRKIVDEDTEKFFWESVILRFGIPRVLISMMTLNLSEKNLKRL